MDIAVAGGTGMLGGQVVAELARRGHDVRVLSRRPPDAPVPGTTHHAVDLVSGDGLRDALAGADAVVEAANTPGTGRKATARAGFVPGNRFALAPVDPRFVASVLADAAASGPGGRRAPVAGPQAAPLRELALGWAQARGRRVRPIALPLPRRNRHALLAGALVPGDDAVTGGPSFGAWLRAPHPEAVAA